MSIFKESIREIKRIHKDEAGVAMIISALCMTVLMMFAALAVDYGFYYLQSSKLQTAVDAAVMAAASVLPNEELAKYEAEKIMEANGFDLNADEEMTISADKLEVEITKDLEVKTSFAQVMQIHTMFTEKSAKAAVTQLKSKFQLEYALFSGSSTDSLPVGGALDVKGGNAHTNNGLEYTMGASDVEFEKDYTYVKDVHNPYAGTYSAGTSTMVENVPMPDYHDSIMEKIPSDASCVTYSDLASYLAANPSSLNVATNTLTINGNVRICNFDMGTNDYAVVINGNLIIDSGAVFNSTLTIGSTTNMAGLYVKGEAGIEIKGQLSFNGYFVAEGDVCCSTVNSIVTGITDHTQSVLYSIEGDINFYGWANTVYGLVYAPEGTVSIEQNYSLHIVGGGLIADVIDPANGSLTIHANGTEFDMEMNNNNGNNGNNGARYKLVE